MTEMERVVAVVGTKADSRPLSVHGRMSRSNLRIRTLLADNESEDLCPVRSMIERDRAFEIVGEVGIDADISEAIFRLRPDLVILDPQVSAGDKFDSFRRVVSELAPAIVFIAATDEHALKAFELDAVDYLLKPWAPGRLAAALHRAKREILEGSNIRLREPFKSQFEYPKNGDHERIFLKASADIEVLKVSEVEWIEAEGDYVTFHVKGRSYIVRGTMAALERRLDPKRFIRIHRSTILNADYLRKVRISFDEDYGIVLCDGTNLRVSRGYLGRLKAMIEGGTPWRA
jgi:two-component system LytT family response regulator